MSKIHIIVFSFLLILSLQVKSQSIRQLGYYTINGISAMSSKTNLILLGDGSLIDISNPSSPNLKGKVGSNVFSTSVLTDGNYAYYGTGMNVKLVIADISNPSSPVLIGTKLFSQSIHGIFGLAKKNNTLYLAMGIDGVFSVDVSNKANPSVLDSIVFPTGQTRDIAISGNLAYVAHTEGFKIINVDNPPNMNIVASISTGSEYYSIDINNNFAFLGKGNGNYGIDVFNISNPYSPVLAFTIPNNGGDAWDLKVKDNLIYLATNSLGLFIYKIAGNSGIEMANFPNTNNGQSFAVSFQDSLIFLSGLINGVAILHYDSIMKNQEIIFEPLQSKFIGDSQFELMAYSSSGLPISYISSNINVATTDGNIVNIISPGSTDITAYQYGNEDYIPAIPVVQTLNVIDTLRTNQVITFEPLFPKNTGDLPFELIAYSTSGLPVTFASSNINVATIAGNILTIHGAGSSDIIAYQTGNEIFDPAISIQTLFVDNISEVENLKNDLISIFPNPSNGKITITLSECNSSNITVTDILGKIVYVNSDHQSGTHQIDLSTSNSGFYIMKIENNHSVYLKKILIQ